MNGNGIQRRLAEEREKIQRLGWSAGLEYIWQYYSLWIIGIASGIALVVFLLVRFLTTPSNVTFYLTLVNIRAEAGTGSELWDGYLSYTGFDPREGQIVFNDTSYFNYADNQGRGNTYYSLFAGLVDAGVLDAVTMEPASLAALGQSGRLMDLYRDECSSLLAKYGDRLLYAVPLDTDYSAGPVPVGFDISDSLLATKYHLYENGCALGIGSGCTRLLAVELFLDYIYAEEASHA